MDTGSWGEEKPQESNAAQHSAEQGFILDLAEMAAEVADVAGAVIGAPVEPDQPLMEVSRPVFLLSVACCSCDPTCWVSYN